MKQINREDKNTGTESNPQDQEEIVNANETGIDEDTITRVLLELEKHGMTEDVFVSHREKHGNVYISYIHVGGQSYFWKKLNRAEYKQILESGAMAKDMSYQEAVLRKCLISPKPDHEFIVSSDAGVVPTVFSQIMYQSGFIPEQLAITYIIEI